MSINFLQGLLYGFISGLTEFLPISSQAHQALMVQIFGMNQRDPVLDFVVHGILLTVLVHSLSSIFNQIKRSSGHFGGYNRSMAGFRLVKNAALPMLLVMLLSFYIIKSKENLLSTSIFLAINGLVLFLPSRMVQGNKDATAMSYFDSFFMGIAGAFGVISGISRIGITTSLLIGRGADRKYALTWSLTLGVYAFALLMVYDLILIFTSITLIPFWGNFFSYLAAAAGSFAGGNLSIRLVRALIKQTQFSGFAFYSWGLALLTFLIYLVIV